ncbi:MAG TPA: porin [Anaeromyxobacteraceae bacterium]|nr:porin [Anaeromyxobacteraceae bacterium]
MRAAVAAFSLLLAAAARAQNAPAGATPADLAPAAAPAASQAASTARAAPEAVGYEPGVGLRYKTPRTQVALYALLEPTLSTVDHADAAGGRQTGYQVSWFSGNRWGLTGSQALVEGDGLKAIFRLESEFELPTGNMDSPGVLFNRDCWAGFEGDLGKLTFGRQNTLARDFAQSYADPYGTANVTLDEGGWTNVNNFKQLIFFAGSATGTRYDNGVVWKKKLGEHVVAGLGYQFGGEPGSFSRNSSGAAGLALNLAPVDVSAFFDEASNDGNNQRSFSVGGNYQLGQVRLNAGYFRYQAAQDALGRRTDDAFTVSAKVAPVAEHLELDAGFQRIKVSNAATNGGGNTIRQFADTSAATATGSGSKATLYGSAIWHFNKLTQVYLALDHARVSGGYRANGAVAGRLAADVAGASASQTELAAGMRLIF